VPDSQVPEDVKCVYEIVINGLTLEDVKRAMIDGLKAAAEVSGVVKISAGNYGGKIGPFKAYLKEAFSTA
jgi:formylmethanofuran--tetrahydromethanopterin N-formyltransferase